MKRKRYQKQSGKIGNELYMNGTFLRKSITKLRFNRTYVRIFHKIHRKFHILRKNRKKERGSGALVVPAPLFALALRVRGVSNRPSARSLRNSAPRCGAFGCAPIAKLRAVRCARSQHGCALSLRGTWFAKRSLWFCAMFLRLVA